MRKSKYDFIRILMSLFVICIHTQLPAVITGHSVLRNALMVLLFICNSTFFMLSGKFNLNKKFYTKSDYMKYYIDKFITIIVPYGLTSCLLVMSDIIIFNRQYNWKGCIYQCLNAFFTTNSQNHLWFMCSLIGMLVSVPFLSKMLENMKTFELKILFSVSIIWNIIAIYLTTDLGFPFRISGFIMWGWIFVFFLGYFCEKIINENNIKILYLVGIIGYIITIIGMTYLDTFANATDLSVCFILFSMACYMFMERHIKIKNETTQKIINFFARYSFLAYMLHYTILNDYVSKLINSTAGIPQYILCVAITFALSYLLAIPLSIAIINPIQSILFKLSGGGVTITLGSWYPVPFLYKLTPPAWPVVSYHFSR